MSATSTLESGTHRGERCQLAPRARPERRSRASLLRDTRGITQAEYAVLFVVIVVGTITAWFGFGADLADVFVEQEQPTNSAAGDFLSRRLDNVGGPSTFAQRLAQALDVESFANEAVSIVQGAADELMELPGAALSAAEDIVDQTTTTIKDLPQTAASAAGKALGDSLKEAGIPVGSLANAGSISKPNVPDVSSVSGAAGAALGTLSPGKSRSSSGSAGPAATSPIALPSFP